MSGIISGLNNLVASIFEIIKGIFVTIFNVFEGALNAVIGLIRNTFNLAEGVVGFIIGALISLVAQRRGYFDLWQATSSFLGPSRPCISATSCISNDRASAQLRFRRW